METQEEDNQSIPCLLLLLIIYLITYRLDLDISHTVTLLFSVSMVGAELYPPVYSNTFTFIMVKYVFGTSHHLLVPLAIILTRPDLRELIKVVFKKGKI